MSSYLNIYGRLRSDLYEVKRLKDREKGKNISKKEYSDRLVNIGA